MNPNSSFGLSRLDAATRAFWRVAGRRLDLRGEHAWLEAPTSEGSAVADAWLDARAAALGGSVREAPGDGLLPDLACLDGPGFAAGDLRPEVRDFYEHTSSWRMEVWTQWNPLFAPGGELVAQLFGRRVRQLALPIRPLDVAHGMDSRVVAILDADGEQRAAGWIRTLRSSGEYVFPGCYTSRTLPGAERGCTTSCSPRLRPEGSTYVADPCLTHPSSPRPRGPRPRPRSWRGFGPTPRGTRTFVTALALSFAITACSSGSTPSTSAESTSHPTSATPAPSPTSEVPDTAAGQQLSWLLAATRELPISAMDLEHHLNADFIDEVPPTKLNQILSSLSPSGGLELRTIESATASALIAIVETSQGPLQLNLSTQADGKIDGLLFQPIPEPAATPSSWDEIEQRLDALAPQTAMVTAEVGRDDACQTIHAAHAERALPIGSMFKLYVLGAVANQVADGDLAWEQRLRITDRIKSLPSGVLQDEPDGAQVSVKDAATKMISISDNTAADLLAQAVGRHAVESVQRTMGSSHADRNTPFLRTRELFVLKGADYPEHADAYLRRSPAQRSRYLDSVVESVARSKITAWQEPRDIESLEWFASPSDLCASFAELDLLASKPGLQPISAIMSANDGGLKLDPKTWPKVWFKGGSEPGVLTLGWLATTADGRSFATVLMAADSKEPIAENTAAPELLALARGAFDLAAR